MDETETLALEAEALRAQIAYERAEAEANGAPEPVTYQATEDETEEETAEPFSFSGFAPQPEVARTLHYVDLGPMATPEEKWRAMFASTPDQEGAE